MNRVRWGSLKAAVALWLLWPAPPVGGQEPPAAGPVPADVAEWRPRSFAEVVGESLLDPLRPEAWRPLGIGSLLTEGWDEPYAPAPGDAPRQTWVGSADGAFYRLYVASYSFAPIPGGGTAYNGTAILFSPLSRRFELGWFVPFVTSAPDAARPAGGPNWTDFGDLTIAPRILLAEDRRYTVTSNLFVRLPTGDGRNGNGAASLSPDVEFWANPFERWVVRGGAGVTVPTNYTPASSALQRSNPWTGFNASPSSFTTFDARLAVGHYLTSGDARFFKSFVYYAAANLHTELSGGDATYLSITPGFRFGVGGDWYFLGGLEVPLVGGMPFDTQTTFQLIKNF
ncbi:transporter [Tundrisphaera sp. TA3]|uniref:transporter n=1 Tax=Tundrisphaera sp. TA3 TaxID=3435775 RepID=UPI003EBD1725